MSREEFPQNIKKDSYRSTQLIQGLTFDEYAKLTSIYSDPTRHYHDLGHIHHVLGTLQHYVKQFPECIQPQKRGFFLPDNAISLVNIQRALWFHDCVYNPYLSDGENELLSARFSFVENSKYVEWTVNQSLVYRMILATAKHTEDQEFFDLGMVELNSMHLLLDIDVCSMAKDWLDFDGDSKKIRKEYHFVNDEQFVAGRSAFFKKMLARKSIFYTPYFQETCEQKARENIQFSLGKYGH